MVFILGMALIFFLIRCPASQNDLFDIDTSLRCVSVVRYCSLRVCSILLNMNRKIEKLLWKKSEKYMKKLQIVPFLRMVSVCNNLAFGKVDEKSDIDIFIIAKKGRLFMVRLFVTFLLHILGVRRHGNKITGRFCLSFFIDDQALNLEKIALRNDIYLAYWIKSMIPLIDDGVSKEFLDKNLWAKRYFENESDFFIKTDGVIKNSKFNSFWNKIFHAIFSGKFGDFIEKRIKSWQIKRAKNKMGKADSGASLIVEDHVLKFHNIDRREIYRNKWFKKFGFEKKITDERFLSL